MKQMMVVTAAKRCQGRIYRFYQNRINSLQSKAILQKIESAWKKSKDEEDRYEELKNILGVRCTLKNSNTRYLELFDIPNFEHLGISNKVFTPTWTIFFRYLKLWSKCIARIQIFNVLIRSLFNFLLPTITFWKHEVFH